MTFPLTGRPRRLKLAVAGALAVLAACLAVADRALEPRVPVVAPVHRDSGEIDAAIDSLLVRHHVDLRSVRSWSVRTPDKAVLRRESRIDVPSSFVSLVFNHDLQNEVVPLGARVIATEHSKEQTVTMHVRKDGQVVRTLVFRMVAAAGPAAGARNATVKGRPRK